MNSAIDNQDLLTDCFERASYSFNAITKVCDGGKRCQICTLLNPNNTCCRSTKFSPEVFSRKMFVLNSFTNCCEMLCTEKRISGVYFICIDFYL